MKSQKKIKLQLIRTLSDPDVMITDFSVSNDYDITKDDDAGWSSMSKTLNGHSTYIIYIYKKPKNET